MGVLTEPYYRSNRLAGISYGGRKFRLSKLGFDSDKLSELDQQRKENQTLSELREIRNRSTLRERNNEKEILGRSLERDKVTLNNVEVDINSFAEMPVLFPVKNSGVWGTPHEKHFN